MRISVLAAVGCMLAAMTGCHCSSCSVPQMPIGDSLSMGCAGGMCGAACEPTCGLPSTGCGCGQQGCASCQENKQGGCLDADILWAGACGDGCGAVCQYGSSGQNCPCARCQGSTAIRPGFVPSCGPTCSGACSGMMGSAGCGCGTAACGTPACGGAKCGCGGGRCGQAARGLAVRNSRQPAAAGCSCGAASCNVSDPSGSMACAPAGCAGQTCDRSCGGSCQMGGGGLIGATDQVKQRMAQKIAARPHVAHCLDKVAYGCANGYCGGRPGPMQGAAMYPYYTVRGPRDFFHSNPPSIGP